MKRLSGDLSVCCREPDSAGERELLFIEFAVQSARADFDGYAVCLRVSVGTVRLFGVSVSGVETVWRSEC